MFKSGAYTINSVAGDGPLYYDELEKRLRVVKGKQGTKFYLDSVGPLELGVFTIQYLKEGTYAHVHLAPGNEGTDVPIGVDRAACYPFVEMDNVNPVVWRVTPINNSVIFMIKVYAGGYGRNVWTTSEMGVMVAPVDEEHETQHFFVARA